MVLTRQVMEEGEGEREAGLLTQTASGLLTQTESGLLTQTESGLLAQTVSVELRIGWVKRME